jgi:hypothetical protein
MASFSTQFHATIEELGSFVEVWMVNHAIYAAAVAYQPFTASPVTKDDVRIALQRDTAVSRLFFCERMIEYAALGNIDLMDKNEGALVLDIGRLGPRGLTESRLSTMAAAATWKKILAHLKKHTKAGVIGVHEQSGASGRYSSQRYTAGAKALFESGIALRQFTQSAVIFQPES